MYVPSAFAGEELALLHNFMERHSFATLVTRQEGGELTASHLPLLLVRGQGERGELQGHMARANDQWRAVVGEALAIFSGPHAYVSPRWYEAENVVPTWNYVAVHAYGPLEIVNDHLELRALLKRMIEVYEAGAAHPWTLERSGAAVDQLLPAIVGFRIPITRLEGKWKLSQNHPTDRQAKVVRELETQPGDDAQAIASLMRRNLEGG